jgi:hypothetical protein
MYSTTDFTSFFESCVPSAIASINCVFVIFAMSGIPLCERANSAQDAAEPRSALPIHACCHEVTGLKTHRGPKHKPRSTRVPWFYPQAAASIGLELLAELTGAPAPLAHPVTSFVKLVAGPALLRLQ